MAVRKQFSSLTAPTRCVTGLKRWVTMLGSCLHTGGQVRRRRNPVIALGGLGGSSSPWAYTGLRWKAVLCLVGGECHGPFSSGPRNITSEITGPDGYATALLAPGESEVITLAMTPTKYAIVGESESVTVEVFQGSTDTTVRDSVEAVAEKIMPMYGDVNGDDCVNVLDLLGVRANLGRGSGCP